MKTKHTLFIVGSCLASLLTTSVHAEYFTDKDPVTSGAQPGSLFVPVAAPTGTTSSISEGWEELTAAAYPDNDVGFPGTGTWPEALESQVGDDAGSNGLDKFSNGFAGGPYPASSGIYYGGMLTIPNTDGGELGVDISAAGLLPGVKTVVLQLDIGEAWTYDLYNDEPPVLTYTTSSGSGTATLSYQILYKETYNGTVSMPSGTEELNINSRAYQFDLSGVTGTITSLSISFNGVQHAQLYGAGLQQFDAASTSVSLLPEFISDED